MTLDFSRSQSLFNGRAEGAEEESITPLFWKSVWAHLILLVFFMSPWNFFLFFKKDKEIDLEKSLRVDLVALPDILAKDTRLAPRLPKVSRSQKISDRRRQKKINVDKDFAKLLQRKRYEKRQAILKTVQKGKDRDALLVKGNVLSLGTHLRGVDKIKYDRYLDEIDLLMKREFLLPEWLKEKNLQAQVKIKVNVAGRVVEKKIIQSSGNTEYDQLILRVVDNASPLPAPPYRFKKILLLKGLILGFPE